MQNDCKYYYYDYDRNCCDNINNISGRCNPVNCHLKEIKYKDEQPCSHPGCLNHVTHPCEECGRIAGRYLKIKYEITTTKNTLETLEKILLAFKDNGLIDIKVL